VTPPPSSGSEDEELGCGDESPPAKRRKKVVRFSDELTIQEFDATSPANWSAPGGVCAAVGRSPSPEEGDSADQGPEQRDPPTLGPQ